MNGIYQHTLRNVSHCPSVSDFIQRTKDKCAEVCTNNIQDDGCSYHCMRDSYKTSLVEFCAKPKLLFGEINLTIHTTAIHMYSYDTLVFDLGFFNYIL